MKIFLLCIACLMSSISSFYQSANSIHNCKFITSTRNNILSKHGNLLMSAERKRRTRTTKGSSKSTDKNSPQTSTPEIDQSPVISTISTKILLDEKESVASLKLKSSLPPISGTIEERQAKFNEKGVLERTIEEYTAPTLPGQEPKLVTLAKNITWFAVILLVIVEIFVSIKSEGMPFDFSKISVPGMTTATPEVPLVP